MIYHSSTDYCDGTMLLLFNGERPTDGEIRQAVGSDYQLLDVEMPSEHKGLQNPGCVSVKIVQQPQPLFVDGEPQNLIAAAMDALEWLKWLERAVQKGGIVLYAGDGERLRGAIKALDERL